MTPKEAIVIAMQIARLDEADEGTDAHEAYVVLKKHINKFSLNRCRITGKKHAVRGCQCISCVDMRCWSREKMKLYRRQRRESYLRQIRKYGLPALEKLNREHAFALGMYRHMYKLMKRDERRNDADHQPDKP